MFSPLVGFSIPYLTRTLGFSPQVALRSQTLLNSHQFLHLILKYETNSGHALFLVDHAAFKDQAAKTELRFGRVGGVFICGVLGGFLYNGGFFFFLVKREREIDR